MDKEFCAEMTGKLNDLDRLLQLRRPVAAATAEKALQMHEQQLRWAEAKPQIEGLRKQVDAVCGGAPLTDALRSEIKRKMATVVELVR